MAVLAKLAVVAATAALAARVPPPPPDIVPGNHLPPAELQISVCPFVGALVVVKLETMLLCDMKQY